MGLRKRTYITGQTSEAKSKRYVSYRIEKNPLPSRHRSPWMLILTKPNGKEETEFGRSKKTLIANAKEYLTWNEI